MIDVAILSMIRRWHFREQVSVREIARRTKCPETHCQVPGRRRGAAALRAPHQPQQARRVCREARTWLTDNARQGRKSRRTLKQMHAIAARWASPAPMIACARLPGAGEQQQERHAPPDAGPSFRSGLRPAKRSSSTGARTGPSSTASVPSCRSRSSSSATAAPSSCGPICCRPTRCCSTRTIMRSWRGAAFHAAASTTT